MAESNVKHFEDLPAKDILEFLSRPEDFDCTEKLDGSNIVVGRDKNGIYTRRDKKEKHYRVEDYELSFFTNYQKLALAALLNNEDHVKQIIDMDEEVGAEVMVGHQPNVVEYFNNTDAVTVVLFKTIGDEQLKTKKGHTGDVECLKVKKNSYTESEPKVVNYKSHIRTLDYYKHDLQTSTQFLYFLVLLCSKQQISGIELPIYEIIDWPLNRRHPAKFDQPWKEVKAEFKEVRERIRELIKQKKMVLDPVAEFGSMPKGINEGYVFTNGDIEFKLVDQDVFLKLKNFIWQFRDDIKQARKQAGEITTLEQVESLRNQYLALIDKYEAERKDELEIRDKLTNYYTGRRSRSVQARDRSAFVTAFEELSRIESEIRRNNRNTESD